MNFSYYEDLQKSIILAESGGTPLNIQHPPDIGKYVFTILAMATKLIPVYGVAMPAICKFLGHVLFGSSPLTMDKIWDGLYTRIANLIDNKMAEYKLTSLRETMQGFQSQIDAYHRYMNDYQVAAPGAQKEKAADTLKSTHISVSNFFLMHISAFQSDKYAVAALPLFTLVATLHLLLLVDGIQMGRSWGYSDRNIQTMKDHFQFLVTPASAALPCRDCPAVPTNTTQLLPGSLMLDAIKDGKKLGLPADMLQKWQDTYDKLYVSFKDRRPASFSGPSYVDYVQKTYEEGRKKLKWDRAMYSTGYQPVTERQMYGDYYREMTAHVLNYAALWPYLAGEEVPQSVLRDIGREVFYGPYGRTVGDAPWNATCVAPVTDPTEPITGIKLAGFNAVDGVSIRYGSEWGLRYGKLSAGEPTEMMLENDEFVTSVQVHSGYKLVMLKFTTSRGRTLHSYQGYDYMNSVDETNVVYETGIPGYRLTSLVITQYSAHPPPGCEGIILGYRPVLSIRT